MTVLILATVRDISADRMVRTLTDRDVPVFRIVIWSLVGIAAVQWPVVR